MSKDFHWEGASILEKKLRGLPAHTEKKILDQSARAGLSHFVKVVKKKIPTDNKNDVHLNKSIKVKKARKTKDKVLFEVGITGKARHYAHVYEFGSTHVQGTHVFTTTFEDEIPNMLKAVSEKIEAGLIKYGSS